MEHKHIILLDAVLILGSLLIIAGIVGYARPLVIAPVNDYVTSNNSVLFEFARGDLVLIDDNLQFTSPTEIAVENDIIVNLNPGTYYWKVLGALESEVRQLTIESAVDLRLRESGNGKYEVVNSGNTKLNVDVYDHGLFTGRVVVGVDDSSQQAGDKFVGGQNG